MSEGVEEVSSPVRLTAEHKISDFESGIDQLDEWLKRRAIRNEETGASRTYVVCAGDRVVGYYAIASGAVAQENATGKIRRNMPEPVPVMVLGRLAVDRRYQSRGIGQGLLRDAVLRIVQASEIAGIRAILVHAISEEARAFYETFGFVSSPVDSMTLMITVADAKRNLR